MSEKDQTKQLLEQILADLYRKQGQVGTNFGDSYVLAQDGQFLGRVTDNQYDRDSMLNSYGPYGSAYSPKSIFNQYSQYASPYGSYSMNNPYSAQPPKLFIMGRQLGYLTKSRYVKPAIDPEDFVFALRNALPQLLQGTIIRSRSEMREVRRESYIEAADGAYLGSLSTNPFDQNSIFNKFGPHGSQFSPQSIFNQFGSYGSQFSSLSPFNQFSSTPPKIFRAGQFAAYLTKNQFLSPRVDPDEIHEWAKTHGG